MDRAGGTLRAWSTNGPLIGADEQAAMDLLSAYRTQFNLPLTKVVMGLRSAVATSRHRVVVGQRLKRQPRIVTKLVRFPRMDLTTMQDIAGCRAILSDLEAVSDVLRLIERQTSVVVSLDDYNLAPKSSGYRGVHLVVRRDGTLIEVQLRTTWQQEWATLVEDIDGAYGLSLKDETGPPEVLAYLRILAVAQHQRHAEFVTDPELLASLVAARDVAVAWLASRSTVR